MSRLPSGGLIDRTRQIPFTFDGRTCLGFRGDTLASALLAQGVRLVGRSFKYHRPRGILTAGPEEPNALVTVATPWGPVANIRATGQEIFRGLQVRSQNRFPSLAFDLGAVADLAAPLLGAGFYYKTFMWPRPFWTRVYEPLIRRAAGLGRLPETPDDTPHDRGFAHCDLLVIGSGAAGLMAARIAGRAGLRVILAEQDFRLGGALNAGREQIAGRPASDWAAEVVDELAGLENIRLMPRTTVLGAYDGGTWAAVERTGRHLPDPPADLPAEVFWRIAAPQAVLATGATERLIAFPGNDRPGVMMAGAIRTYLNRYAVLPGRQIAVFTNNDSGHVLARDLCAAGAEVVRVVDTRPDAKALADYPILTDARVIATHGRLGLSAITVRGPGGSQRIACDCLAVSGGWNPNVQLSCHLGARPVWNAGIAAFVPAPPSAPGAVPGLIPAGAAAGETTLAGALTSGAEAGRRAVRAAGGKVPRVAVPKCSDTPDGFAPFWHVAEGKGRAFLDLANDVTVKDVAQALHENYCSPEHLKRYTTLGMAPDQGRTGNVTALGVMSELTGTPLAELGTTTFRPPQHPVSLGVLGAGGRGKGFQPTRLLPAHGFHRDLGARFVEAGLWLRPAWYPRPGETGWRQSCDREAAMVRSAVGLFDASSLGKIEVAGPDAARFLDRVYANRVATLEPGRIRYGLMLREDGFVMDDGTVTRLAPGHFLLTTTSEGAGQVLAHLEFCAQVLWPDLAVTLLDVTEQWAQFAVAGPQSRALLEQVTGADLPDGAPPFMGFRALSLCDTPARLFRISFSGELGFEIAVPADMAESLARLLTARAEALGGGWYGIEAANVLRIEKGFPTHAEMDGRTTAADLGLGRLVADKDSIGRVMAARPALTDPARPQLVGLKPAGAVRQFTGGAQLFLPEAAPVLENVLGHVTSHCFSPALGHPIALALVAGGRGRMGQRLKLVDHVRDLTMWCEVCPPCFIDPEGGRMRG